MTVTVSGDTVPRSSVALVLPPLPYAYDALKPYLGEETLRIHHDKHHAKVQYICLCHSIYVHVEYSTVQYSIVSLITSVACETLYNESHFVLKFHPFH